MLHPSTVAGRSVEGRIGCAILKSRLPLENIQHARSELLSIPVRLTGRRFGSKTAAMPSSANPSGRAEGGHVEEFEGTRIRIRDQDFANFAVCDQLVLVCMVTWLQFLQSCFTTRYLRILIVINFR